MCVALGVIGYASTESIEVAVQRWAAIKPNDGLKLAHRWITCREFCMTNNNCMITEVEVGLELTIFVFFLQYFLGEHIMVLRTISGVHPQTGNHY